MRVAGSRRRTDEPAECPPPRDEGGEPDVPSRVRKDRHVPGTSGLSIRSFNAGVAGDASASAPIFACVWPFSAGAASEAISPDAPDGCGSRTSSPEVHRPALGNPVAASALSPTEARVRSRRLAEGFLTPDPIKRRATKGSGSSQTGKARASAREHANSAVRVNRSLRFMRKRRAPIARIASTKFPAIDRTPRTRRRRFSRRRARKTTSRFPWTARH